MATFAVEGFATLSQNYISKTIASNFYPKLPFMAALGALTLGNNNKDVLQIGRPGVGEILSGRVISPAERLTLGTVNAYLPRIQRFETSNTVKLTKYGSMPTLSNPTTAAQSMAMQASAKFCWTEFITPIEIQHEDKIRAGQGSTKEGQAIAMSQVIDEATEVAMQEHVKAINTDIWAGNVGDQSLDLWDSLSGILYAVDDDNTYGNINRATSANAPWRSNVDTTFKAVDIIKLLDDANLVKGLRVYGPGADLCICNINLYPTFKQQVLSSGGVVLQNGMPKMASLGVKQEVLQKDNCYIMYDSTCPANQVYFFTGRTWRIAFHPERNMSVTPFVDLTKTGRGAADADLAYIRTRMMMSCDNPALQVRYEAVGT